jgi:L-cysteine/cystine lyase
MANRKEFLGSMGALALGTMLSCKAKANGVEEENPIVKNNINWGNIPALFSLKKEITFLNNGTNGICPKPVLAAINNSLNNSIENGVYGGGKKELVKKLAAFIGADKEEIALTHNVTEGNNIVCWGLPLRKGDEVLISDQEHVGNALAWLNRAKLEGIVMKKIDIICSGEELLDRIKKAIGPKTRAITIPHIPCTNGQVNPVKEICALAKEKGIYSIIDGAHGPGMLNIDVKDMGCDAYVSCGHKWMLGPAGTGFIYVKKAMLDTVQTKFVGAYCDTGWDIETGIKGYADNAHRYYYGTQSAALFDGWSAAIDFQNTLGKENIESFVKELSTSLRGGLMELDSKVEINTPADLHLGGIIGFKFKEKDTAQFVTQLRKEKTILRYVAESGLNSIRVSTHLYNTKEQVNSLLEKIRNY